MESKKINQLATELTPALDNLTIIGDPTTGISKKITLSQMASLFTGTVEEYANLAAFPLVGVADTIYIALDTNVLYRWNTGTNAYVELSPNIINSLVFSDANGFDGTISLVGSTATLTITTALTQGSVPFIGASGALSQDNANLFFDDTNNRLGINTNVPTTAIDAFGSGIIGRLNGTSTNNSFLGFASAGTNQWSIGNVQSDHRFRIYSEANTAELISVLQTGEFGIGIANPTTKLHIDGGATALIANLDANVSVAKSVSFRSDNSNRFNIEVSGTESGSNAGANFFIRRYSDAGALIDTPLTITRSTGAATFSSSVSATQGIFSNISSITNADQSGARLVIANTGTGGQSVNLVAGNPNLDNTGFSIAYGNTNFLRFTSTGAATFSNDLTIAASGQIYLTSGDLRYSSNAGFGIVTQNGGRLVSIQNGAFGVTGAATFSSSVTSNNRFALDTNTTSPSDGNAYFYKSSSGAVISGFQFIAETGGAGSRGTRLTIDNTGAATFSSSVTVGGSVNIASGYNVNFNNASDAFIYSDASGGGRININGTNQLQLSTASAPRLTITNLGNIGIGTTVPNNTANYSTLSVAGTSGGQITWQTGTSLKGYLYNTSSALILGADTGNYLAFEAGAVERMRITSGGNVGIKTQTPSSHLQIVGTGTILTLGESSGTTGKQFLIGIDASSGRAELQSVWQGSAYTPISLNPIGGNVLIGTTTDSGAKLTARFASSGNPTISATNTNASNSRCYYGQKASGSTDDYYMIFDNAVDNKFLFYGNGGLGNVQANNVNISDERTKKDIIPLESYWDKIKAIEIVKFKYKDQTHDDFNIGVIAQQVEAVAPEFIEAEDWGKDTPTQTQEPLKSVYTTDLYHATIKVLQEAMAKIETLETELTELKTKIK